MRRASRIQTFSGDSLLVGFALLACVLGAPLRAAAQTPARRAAGPASASRRAAVPDPKHGIANRSNEAFYRPLPLPDTLPNVPSGHAPEYGSQTSNPPADPVPQRAVADGAVETLEDAWRIALRVDEPRRAGRARVDAAERAFDAAVAHRSPTADLSGQYTLRDNEPAYVINTPLLPYSFNSPYLQSEDFALEARVDVPLYTGGRITNRIAAAESKARVARQQLDRYQLDLKMRVAEDYVAVLRAEQELLLAESHERSLRRHMRDIELFYRQERAPLNDLLSAQVACSNARYRVAEARSELDAARASYNRRLGRPLTADVSPAQLSVTADDYDVEQLTEVALARRRELAELDAQIAAHRHAAEMALAENRARVHLQGAYTFRENRFQIPEGITSAGIGASWNLFDGGRARSLAEEEMQRAQALAHEKADTRTRIRLQVRRGWLALRETRQRLQATSQAIERAEENLRVTSQRYANGMATNTEVLAAETLRVQTYSNHNNAVYDRVLASLALQRATATFASRDVFQTVALYHPRTPPPEQRMASHTRQEYPQGKSGHRIPPDHDPARQENRNRGF